MTNDATSLLNFVPIGRTIIDPLEMPTAVSLAVYNRPSSDTHILQDPNGDLFFEVLNPRTGKDEVFRIGDDHAPAQEAYIAFVHGSAVLTKSLRVGEIETFVIAEDGRYLRVPRLYWLQAFAGDATHLKQTGFVADNLVGLALLVDPAHIAKWKDVAAPEVAAMLGRIRAANGRPDPVVRRLSAKQGRNKTRTREIDGQILEIFRRHHDRLVALTEIERHEKVAGLWSRAASAPSKNTVNRRWREWLEERAGEARNPKAN